MPPPANKPIGQAIFGNQRQVTDVAILCDTNTDTGCRKVPSKIFADTKAITGKAGNFGNQKPTSSASKSEIKNRLAQNDRWQPIEPSIPKPYNRARSLSLSHISSPNINNNWTELNAQEKEDRVNSQIKCSSPPFAQKTVLHVKTTKDIVSPDLERESQAFAGPAFNNSLGFCRAKVEGSKFVAEKQSFEKFIEGKKQSLRVSPRKANGDVPRMKVEMECPWQKNPKSKESDNEAMPRLPSPTLNRASFNVSQKGSCQFFESFVNAKKEDCLNKNVQKDTSRRYKTCDGGNRTESKQTIDTFSAQKGGISEKGGKIGNKVTLPVKAVPTKSIKVVTESLTDILAKRRDTIDGPCEKKQSSENLKDILAKRKETIERSAEKKVVTDKTDASKGSAFQAARQSFERAKQQDSTDTCDRSLAQRKNHFEKLCLEKGAIGLKSPRSGSVSKPISKGKLLSAAPKPHASPKTSGGAMWHGSFPTSPRVSKNNISLTPKSTVATGLTDKGKLTTPKNFSSPIFQTSNSWGGAQSFTKRIDNQKVSDKTKIPPSNFNKADCWRGPTDTKFENTVQPEAIETRPPFTAREVSTISTRKDLFERILQEREEKKFIRASSFRGSTKDEFPATNAPIAPETPKKFVTIGPTRKLIKDPQFPLSPALLKKSSTNSSNGNRPKIHDSGTDSEKVKVTNKGLNPLRIDTTSDALLSDDEIFMVNDSTENNDRDENHAIWLNNSPVNSPSSRHEGRKKPLTNSWTVNIKGSDTALLHLSDSEMMTKSSPRLTGDEITQDLAAVSGGEYSMENQTELTNDTENIPSPRHDTKSGIPRTPLLEAHKRVINTDDPTSCTFWVTDATGLCKHLELDIGGEGLVVDPDLTIPKGERTPSSNAAAISQLQEYAQLFGGDSPSLSGRSSTPKKNRRRKLKSSLSFRSGSFRKSRLRKSHSFSMIRP